MNGSPKVYFKNRIDLDNPDVTITVFDSVATSNGQDSANHMRNRNFTSGHMTTGSNDTATFYFDVDMKDEQELETLLLMGHSYRDFTVKLWNGTEFVDFSTPINITDNTQEFTELNFDTVATSKFRVSVTATIVPNSEKKITRLIATRKIRSGQFNGNPEFKNVSLDLGKKVTDSPSGKAFITDRPVSYSATIQFANWPDDNDLGIFEDMFLNRREGVEFWPCGGDETQFSSLREGWRLKDLYLVRPVNEWNPDWYKSIYTSGMVPMAKLREIV